MCVSTSSGESICLTTATLFVRDSQNYVQTTSTVFLLLSSHLDNQAIVHPSCFNDSLPLGAYHNMIITHTRSNHNIFHILESHVVLVKLALHPELFPSVLCSLRFSSDSLLCFRLLLIQIRLVEFAEQVDPRSLRSLSPSHNHRPLASFGSEESILRSFACRTKWLLFFRRFFARGIPGGRGCSSERSSELTCCERRPIITRTCTRSARERNCMCWRFRGRESAKS